MDLFFFFKGKKLALKQVVNRDVFQSHPQSHPGWIISGSRITHRLFTCNEYGEISGSYLEDHPS